MKKIVALFIAVLMIAALTAACAEVADVTMAFCTWTGYSPMFIAQENGYFADAGINMNIMVIEDESTTPA